MYNPPHPGQIVKQALVDNTGLSVTKVAEILGVQRITVSKLIHGKSGISPEMAIRLSIALGTSSQMWINMQAMYDLAKAEKRRKKLKVKPLRALHYAVA